MYGTLAAVCLAALFLGSANADTRIVNGQPIHISQAPYIVQLRKYNQPFCGGTLVHPQFVVSAAHCFDNNNAGEVEIVAGANTRTEDGVSRRIVRLIKPSLYTRENMNGDVAILKLDSPLPIGPLIKPVNLCSAPVPSNHLLQVSGWGRTYTNGPGSHPLLTVNVGVMDLNECRSKFRWSMPTTNYMICAHPSQMDSCQGDSGGPAIYNGELCGVVSFGGDCASTTPGMYSNVFELRSFIYDAIRSMM